MKAAMKNFEKEKEKEGKQIKEGTASTAASSGSEWEKVGEGKK